ncbi:hypothetical protein DL546_005720 [Coniochaeta pulveracea]|uniref:Aminoglycoside phosphotransferase domain-containing protein n=1 Tax=Coniochaeta pulveracea TaxID=177199 RepID=A0A420Y5P0_9PEZI|nr:hypothetical protein DL546_005720 [Coniochaeta pulveracea]
MAQQQELSPDQQVLRGIFPDVPDISEDSYNIISNTFGTCTFRLQLSTEPKPDFPTDLLVRLETSGGRLLDVARYQRLACLQNPTVVPATLDVGFTTNASGTRLEYSVTPFLGETVLLEDVWNDLEQRTQSSLMDSIVDAMAKHQELPVGNDDVRRLLQLPGQMDQVSTSSVEPLIGGPDVGYHASIKQLLAGFLGEEAGKSPTCKILDTANGIAIRSLSDDIGEIELSQADLDILCARLVLCHNDLEPRNILVKLTSPGEAGPGTWYELAAIIDWELAGFFPFAYEFGLKDCLLGSSNLSFTWYSLFKERAAALLPEGESHDKLIKALRIIAQSKDLGRPRNVGVRFQARWRERERLELSSDPRRGWVRQTGAENIPTSTKEDDANLEHEVLRELGYM